MNFYGGGYGSGGGSQSSMMMMSSFSAICLSLVIGGLALFLMNQKPTVTTTPAPIVTTTGDEEVEQTDFSGAQLVTVGGISMMVEGDSCGNGKVLFSPSKTDKWLWRLHSAGTYNTTPIYYIESFYKNFSSACDERWLTAPNGCNGPPFLANRENGPRQRWMLTKDGNGHQIRSLACVMSRSSRQSLMMGQQNAAPFFTDGGSGSTFSLTPEN